MGLRDRLSGKKQTAETPQRREERANSRLVVARDGWMETAVRARGRGDDAKAAFAHKVRKGLDAEIRRRGVE